MYKNEQHEQQTDVVYGSHECLTVSPDYHNPTLNFLNIMAGYKSQNYIIKLSLNKELDSETVAFLASFFIESFYLIRNVHPRIEGVNYFNIFY